MNVRVLGCHGGASLHHRTVSFLVDRHVALDAGALAGGLTVAEQGEVRVALITHSHMDHVGDLDSLVDLRSQQGGFPLVVAGMAETIEALRTHFFNDVLWPDFTRIALPGGPAVDLQVLELEAESTFCGLTVRPILVDHTVPSCGFLVGDAHTTLAYSGDTGPTDRFWKVLNGVDNLSAVITEVSFPDAKGELARVSGHLTPTTLVGELAKLDGVRNIPIYVYGLKPSFEREIRAELEALVLDRVRVLDEGDELEL
jgi:cAMP phosphodiesterase